MQTIIEYKNVGNVYSEVSRTDVPTVAGAVEHCQLVRHGLPATHSLVVVDKSNGDCRRFNCTGREFEPMRFEPLRYTVPTLSDYEALADELNKREQV